MNRLDARLRAVEKQIPRPSPSDRPPMDTALVLRVQGYYEAFQEGRLPCEGIVSDLYPVIIDLCTCYQELTARQHLAPIPYGGRLWNFCLAFSSLCDDLCRAYHGEERAERRIREAWGHVKAGRSTATFVTAWCAWALILGWEEDAP
jgi:hypothetical protein